MLHRDADCNTYAGMPAVIQVVAVIVIDNINVVGVIPIGRPITRIWIDHTEPVATILEARISTDYQEGKSANAEAMSHSKVATETIVRNAKTVVSAPLLPAAVIGLPVASTVLLPCTLLKSLLLGRALKAVITVGLLRMLLLSALELPLLRTLALLRPLLLLRALLGVVLSALLRTALRLGLVRLLSLATLLLASCLLGLSMLLLCCMPLSLRALL